MKKSILLKSTAILMAGLMAMGTLPSSVVFASENHEVPYNEIQEGTSRDTIVTWDNDGSDYGEGYDAMVIIPKNIPLDKQTKSADYGVTVKGRIRYDEKVKVVPRDEISDLEGTNFYMKDQSSLDAFKKADVPATVVQPETEWTVDEVTTDGTVKTGSISAPGLTFGSWSGNVTFDINLEHTDGTHTHDFVDGMCTKCGISESVTGSQSDVHLSAGFYDADNNLVVSWEESGIDVSKDHEYDTVETDATSGHSVLQNYSNATKVVIPDSVTSIGSWTFYGCANLTSIIIPNSVTSIGDKAFYDCKGLTSIIIPNSVTNIGDYAFEDCTSLININIPNNVTSISKGVFQNCSSLTNITIPSSVTSIGINAFQYCKGLTSITISSSVTSIGNYAFAGCSSVTRINIPNSVTSIGDYAFMDCTNLTNIIIPNSVTSIGVQAFAGCSSLTSITIPSSVTSIGDYAFEECPNLNGIKVSPENTVYDSRNNCNAIIETATNILIAGCQNTIIPNDVTSIGDLAFKGCSNLTSINIPNSVTSIGDYAFNGCTSLTNITIPSSVTSIGDGAFENCYALTSITIPNSVTSIGDSAFKNCYALTSITIPSSVTSIGVLAFSGCTGLTSIKVSPENTVYDSRNNCNAIIETATNILIAGCQNTIIPKDVTSIGIWAFYDCSSLTSITIPSSVTIISYGAFTGCSNLTSITIPNSVISIGDSAFENCYALTSITIPSSVTSIGESAFYECTSLTTVNYTGTQEQWNSITIGYNEALFYATINYNYTE